MYDEYASVNGGVVSVDCVSELYVGVDVHESKSQVAVYKSDGTLLEERSLSLIHI